MQGAVRRVSPPFGQKYFSLPEPTLVAINWVYTADPRFFTLLCMMGVGALVEGVVVGVGVGVEVGVGVGVEVLFIGWTSHQQSVKRDVNSVDSIHASSLEFRS